jgi:SAM-dependent methyltransferase
LTGGEDQNWSRVVMRRECRQFIEALQPGRLKALEISGSFFGEVGFREYKSVQHPEYDVCAEPLPDTFDLIIAEQVFEHLLWPYRAGRNVYQMLNTGGHFLISTPFLVKVHKIPDDCTRWTETGLKYFLAECGFPLEGIRTGSWGNTACVKAHLREQEPVRYRRRIHSLHNEPDYPYHVWALAQK